MKTITKLTFPNLLVILCLSLGVSVFAQPTSLPRLQINDLEYQGAFAIPSNTPNNLSANYSTGTIAYNAANNSLFVSGHEVYGTVGEFSIPALVNTKTNVSALNQATLLQGFRPILNAAATGNPQNIDKITGMAVINGRLIVNGEDRYDAAADNTHTTVAIENPSNIAGSTVNGYYSFQGAAHAGGWMAPIPAEWQSLLGGSYITGHSSRYSINSRYPMGITAFAFNPSNISGASGTVPTTTLLDFSLANPLYADYNYVEPNYNLVDADLSVVGGNIEGVPGHTFAQANATVGTNDLWTELSQASYGFIVPGTRTYLTIGSSGGHDSGIGYKPTQNSGYQCPGPCSYDAEDYYNYYWLWDVNDLLDVKNGVKSPHDIRPYDHGVFEALFRSEVNPTPLKIQKIAGGTFDANNGILYLSVYHGASNNQDQRLPAIVAYKINGGGNNCPTAGTPCNDNDPNTTNDVEDGFCNCSGTPITPPSGECELLTNTDFDNDLTGNWGSWGCTPQAINGIANITNIVSGSNTWEAGFIQSGITIEQGESYNIKFRARAANNRPVQVLVQFQGAPYTQYYATTVNLTTNMQDYNLSFTMNEPTDNNTNFIFQLGGNSTNTYIDNASLTKVDCGSSCPTAGTPCNDGDPNTTNDVEDGFCNCSGTPVTPPSDCELLTNINFDNNTNNWVEWGCSVAAVNGVANITNINPGINPWEVGFSQSNQNLTLVQGETYEVTFRARAAANREMYLYVGMLNSPYTAYHYQTVNLTTTMQQFTATFTMNSATDNNVNFDFNLGGNATNTYIDFASLRIADCGGCPSAGTPCNDGDPSTINDVEDGNCNCNGTACPSAGTPCNDGNPNTINDVEDGFCNCNGTTCPSAGTPCNDGDPNTTNDVEDGFCNCSGTPITPPSDCELLTNTNFDNNINNWAEWGCSASSVNGIANITNIISATNPWEVGFSQGNQNLTLQQGETYTITFRARADANRTIRLYVGMRDSPYTAYHLETYNLTTSMQEFSRTFTMDSPTDTNINFDFNFGGNTTNTYIDFASLRKVNCGGNCPAAGTPCNDGDSNTTNDVEDGFCNCSGTPVTPPSGQCDCPDLSTNGTVTSVSNITQLENAINNSNGNETIMVQPGDYVLNYGLIISADKPNLTIMGATGNRDDVTLRGLGWNNSAVTHIFDVSADGFTVANMTISDVYYHLIQIHSENDADDFTAQNVRFLDGKEQLLKVSAGASTFSDRGKILCCAFEFTNGIAYQNYTGGIDAHKSKDWLVQNNTFEGIRSPDGVVAEHAIHFWRDCENTTVIGNKIERCDRGIGFGLGDAYENGHRGGLIMNNFIHTNRDVGIGLEYAPDIRVYNNTVITDNYFNSIEYRFSGTTNVQIINNLVSKQISDRSSGSTGTLATNYTVSNFNIFTNSGNYDYHLAGTPSGIVNAGTPLSEVSVDIDCDNRSGGIDIGADEVSGGNNGNDCQQQGQTCDDGNDCTTGSSYDANCDCVGGVYTDADGDGLCIGEDPDDNDPCNPNVCGGCDVFDDQDFESNWGIWNDGGSDARRNVNDAPYANSGSRCIRLRDNSGAVSSMYTDALDMSAVTSVDVSFSYIANSMENNEDFFLEVSTDNGTSYAVVGRWIRGRDFDNGTRYNETVTIDGPLSSNTRLRLRCDASGNGDLVYIDDVTIEACGGAIVPAKLEVLPASISVNLYPNPANHSIQLDCEMSESTQAQIQVYDNIGQLVKSMTNIELHEGTQTLNIDVSDLPAGMYFCALQSNEWQTVKKFVIAR